MLIDARDKRPRAPDGVPRLLRDLIHERTGIYFEDSRSDILLDKLEPLAQARGCDSFLHYYYLLKDDEHDEWNRAWEALSVQETYFWREVSQINALAQKVLPGWFASRPGAFTIWCAACATGEEPYSIAISLIEAGFGSHPIEIIASDASHAALEKARAGVFREKSFRALPLHLRHKYFETVEGGSRISPVVADRVRFKRVNLLDPAEIASIGRVQAVFCRNVFIYFSPHSIRQAVAVMATKMASGGCLFVGASESLLKMTTDFELREIGEALAYVRI